MDSYEKYQEEITKNRNVISDLMNKVTTVDNILIVGNKISYDILKGLNDTQLELLKPKTNHSMFNSRINRVVNHGTAINLPVFVLSYKDVVSVKALSENTGKIYLANSKVEAEDHSIAFPLNPGEGVELKIADLGSVWIDADVSGEGVTWISEKIRTNSSTFGISQAIPGTTNNVTNSIIKNQVLLKEWTEVAADINNLSSILDLTNVKYVGLEIYHGRDIETAFVGFGTQYRVLVSPTLDGNDWVSQSSVVCDITVANKAVSSAATLIGATVIPCGATTPPAVGDTVFMKDADITKSEMGMVILRDASGANSFTLLHGLKYPHATAQNYYSMGQKIPVLINAKGYMRAQVVCNNFYGTTNRAIVWSCKVVSQI
jgi:hypothetical protein